MVLKEHIKKMIACILILTFVISFFTISAVVWASATDTPYSLQERDDGYAGLFVWKTETMLGDLPTDHPVILHEQYPNTLNRYALDFPKDLTIYEDKAWWDWWGKGSQTVKEIGYALNIPNMLANWMFWVVKAISMVCIMLIQISMGAAWTTWLFSLFGAVTKVIGVALLAQNLFYIAMICLGGYLIYQGLIRRKLSTTIGETVLSICLLAFTIYFVTNPVAVMKGINDTTDALGTWILQIGASRDLSDNLSQAIGDDNYVDNTNASEVVENNPTSLQDLKKNAIIDVTNKLFVLQVRAPWEILQFGEIDINLSNPTLSRKRVVVHEEEVQALIEVFKNNGLTFNSGEDVNDESDIVRELVHNGVQMMTNADGQPTLVGVPWSELILSIPSEQQILRDILISVLGTKGTEDAPISQHDNAVEALSTPDAKMFSLLFIMLTTMAMAWFIFTISVGLFLAQLVVLASMVVGPFILLASGLPKFGHRYVKNWALITLGAFGAKVMFYAVMGIMFLLISVVMTIAYDIDSLNLDQETKDNLSFFNMDGTRSLGIVHVLILLIMIAVDKFRKKLFVRQGPQGQFGLAGQLIHNASKGEFKNSAQMYTRAVRGENYADLVERSENQHFKYSTSKLPALINPLNMKFGKNKNGEGNDGQGSANGEGNDGQGSANGATNNSQNNDPYADISNHPQLTHDQYLQCPITGGPCTQPNVGFQNQGPCSDHGYCPYHEPDNEYNGKQSGYIMDGAEKYSTNRRRPGDNRKVHPPQSTVASPTSSEDYEFDDRDNASVSVQRSYEDGKATVKLTCPIDRSNCTNIKVAYANSGSPHCSVKNTMCPFRNMADADHYNYMQRIKKRQQAQDTVKLRPIDAPQFKLANTPEAQPQGRRVNVQSPNKSSTQKSSGGSSPNREVASTRESQDKNLPGIDIDPINPPPTNRRPKKDDIDTSSSQNVKSKHNDVQSKADRSNPPKNDKNNSDQRYAEYRRRRKEQDESDD